MRLSRVSTPVFEFEPIAKLSLEHILSNNFGGSCASVKSAPAILLASSKLALKYAPAAFALSKMAPSILVSSKDAPLKSLFLKFAFTRKAL